VTQYRLQLRQIPEVKAKHLEHQTVRDLLRRGQMSQNSAANGQHLEQDYVRYGPNISERACAEHATPRSVEAESDSTAPS
jgi:hypothetical protein